MDTNSQNQVPMQTPVNPTPTPPMTPENKSEVGPIIATIVIIIIIIVGGLYFWGKRVETEKANQEAMQSVDQNSEMAASIQATKIETVSQDDSLNTLKNELNSTNTTNLNAGL
jgi:uncharacterized protein YpmB